jgi:hypothetical protein
MRLAIAACDPPEGQRSSKPFGLARPRAHERAEAASARALGHGPKGQDGVHGPPLRGPGSAPFWGQRSVVCLALGTAQYCRAPEERLAVSPLLRMTPPRRLLALAPEHVLVGHGEGIHVDAPAALRDAVRLARRRASSLAWAGLRAHARFHRPAR